MNHDFVIIGAGPAGAFAAAELSRQSHSVLVLDAQKEIRRKVCGEYLCPKGLTFLKENGLYSHFEGLFLPVTGMNIHSPCGKALQTSFPSKNQIHQGLSLNRQLFDQKLVELAREAGSDVRFDHRVTSIERVSQGWAITCLSGQQYRAKRLIGADGKRSMVAKHFQVQLKSNTHRVAVHCNLQVHNHESRQGEMHLFTSHSYIGINPINPKEINLSLVCDANEIKTHGGTRALLNHYLSVSPNLRQRFQPIDATAEISAVSPLQHRVSRTSGPGWCLIGDAGGFLDPLTGEGIFQALDTAKRLTDAISHCTPTTERSWNKAFKIYSRKRKQQFQMKTRINRGFQWVIRHPHVIEALASYLSSNPRRPDAFVGLIGNVYTPLEGIRKIITA